MKILVDTNIIISALLYPNSKPAAALTETVDKHKLVLTDYNIAELHRVVKAKFPSKLPDVDVLLAKLPFELVSAPISAQKLIADPKRRADFERGNTARHRHYHQRGQSFSAT